MGKYNFNKLIVVLSTLIITSWYGLEWRKLGDLMPIRSIKTTARSFSTDYRHHIKITMEFFTPGEREKFSSLFKNSK